jgi:hypothetical protein
MTEVRITHVQLLGWAIKQLQREIEEDRKNAKKLFNLGHNAAAEGWHNRVDYEESQLETLKQLYKLETGKIY